MQAVWNIFKNADEEQEVDPSQVRTGNASTSRPIPSTFHVNSRGNSGKSQRGYPNVASRGNWRQHGSAESYEQVTAEVNHPRGRINQRGYNPSNRRGYQSKSKKHQSRAVYVQHGVDYDLSSNLPRSRARVKEESDEDESCKRDTMAKKERKPGYFGFKKMRELVDRDSNEILLTLSMPNNGFAEMLEKLSDHRDFIAYTLIALGKACLSSHRLNLSSLLTTVTQSKLFMYAALQLYLATFNNSKNEEYHLESLVKLSEFLDCYQKCLTASATETLQVLLPLFKIACLGAFKNSPQRLEFIQSRIEELDKHCNDFINCHSQPEIKKASKVELLSNVQPPEDYHSIPILPCEKDIFEHVPFLRPNVVEGKYANAEHYLDVQFRLLREDYVRPLREGIATYRRLKKLGHPMSRNKEVRIYQGVQVIKQDFFNGNLIHVAMFNVKEFSRVNWEHSKRFLTGSLLCLSSDDFNTMLFASVAFRDAQKLKDGFLLLRFEELSSETLNISPLQIFTMVETSAYFEAYRHNLTALHAMTADIFPLKDYIVDVQKEVKSPAYLSVNTTYDMVPLLDVNGSQSDSKVFSTHGFKPVKVVEQLAKTVAILYDSQWLSATELGLDTSQYKALKTAITKQFAIIQGPPGTGKTYVGLKIVQLLLHNVSKWNDDSEKISPILIVCYTNHALDQFLEGIRNFTDDIVRVGGRCANEILARYQLKNLRRVVKEKRTVPSHIFSNVKHQHFILDQLRKAIGRSRKEMERSLDNLLSEEVLKPYMTSVHYESLKGFLPKDSDDGLVVMDWLALRFREFEDEEENIDNRSSVDNSSVGNASVAWESGKAAAATPYVGNDFQGSLLNQKLVSNRIGDKLLGEEEEEEEEFDTEYVEGMRDIDMEDYSGLTITENTENSLDKFLSSMGGWQVQGGMKKRKQYIMKQLSIAVPLAEAHAKRIRDVWLLSPDVRWQLYKYWLQKFIEAKQSETLDLQVQIQDECTKLSEMRTEEDLHVLRNAKVVGMTTTGAAKYRNIVLNVKPKIVVVEEAAEVLEAHIVTSLVQETQHLILIGDHQQLRPSPNVYDLAVRFNLNISLFERMVKNSMPYCQLMLQHRMRPSIAELLVPHIYPDLKNHESVMNFENIKGTVTNMFFVSHNFLEGSEIDSTSKVNEHETKFVVQLCKYLLLQGYNASQITILTTYTGQLMAIKKISKTDMLKGVRITVVDNYQGEENDIIIISFVRSNDEGSIGFLKVSNRVCVALSRARKGLYCIGNFHLLAEKSDLWKNILETLHKQNAIGPALKLQCQNHKEVITEVAKESDFSKVAEGGCSQLCNYRLACGHTCPKICHSYDREHKQVKCQKPCSKILCEDGHKCTKPCFKPCGPCRVLIQKTLSPCNHKVAVPCCIPPSEFKCTQPCVKLLSCGHKCLNKCGETCGLQRCTENVSRNLLCGHILEMLCSDYFSASEHVARCTSPCQLLLLCGHKCSGSCGRCHQGRLHIACRKSCGRILVCGHKCKSPCSNICPPCKAKCENRCSHSQCRKKCGEPCNKCSEPCSWSCEHRACGSLCGDSCDIQPCNKPCKEMLKCGHQCIGLCGEPCPNLCAICDRQQVCETFFGMEKDRNAVFIQLEDCGDVFEVQGLTHWMTRESKGKIEMKSCPKCKRIIRNNFHFSNIIKSCLSDIEKVKSIIYGDVAENKAKRLLLISDLAKLKVYVSFRTLLLPIQKDIEHQENLSSMQVMRFENIIKIAEVFLPLRDRLQTATFKSILRSMFPMPASQAEILVSNFILNEYKTASEQQFHDIDRELVRLHHLEKFISVIRDTPMREENNVNISCFADVTRCLGKLGRFEKEDEALFDVAFKKLCTTTNIVLSDPSFQRKILTLRSMDLSQGNWFYCARGHIYCTKETTHVLQQSMCPKCDMLARVPVRQNMYPLDYDDGSSTDSYYSD